MPDSPSLPVLFRPVPTKRRRHDGWTSARQELFLIYLEQLGIVSAAARAAGMSSKSAYALLKRSEAEQSEPAPGKDDIPSFAEAWRLAVELGRGHACDLAISRAINGEVRPIFYRGRQVGERIVYNDALINTAVQLTLRDRKTVDSLSDVDWSDLPYGYR